MTNASEKVVFHVSTRQVKGTGNVSRLRSEGKLPGNVYGLSEKSIAIIADYRGVKKLYDTQGDTGLIYLQIDDEKKQLPVLIDEVAYTKIGENILHISFKRVSLSVKIEAEIPVVMTGETKIDGAIVSLVKDFVLIEALPTDLLENFEVDISVLKEVGQSITLEDLNFDKSKISLVLNEGESPSDVMLVNVQELKEEVEEEPEAVVSEGAEPVDGTKTEDSATENDKPSDNKSESAS